MMRLLKVDEAGGFSLVKFQSGQIPKYAILSHTWGHEDDEMTFQDMVSGSGQDKQGYRKLEFCAAQARRDQLDYFWIDTCCIDKTNSVELNTAINSMFNWYERAARCYAFLADAVVWAGPGHDWQFDLRNSEWFRRGWTLQELLAPKSVEFYSPDHARLGDKLSLALEIGEITGIPVDALQGHLPLSSFTVQERFAWIKNRETTREEDKVYSLVGIFDVSLVPCYGEGLKKASRRLRRAIKAASEEDDELDDFWGSAATRPPFVATGLAQQEHRGGRPTMNLRSKREPRSNGEAQRMTGDGTGTVGYSDSPRRESRDWPTTGLSFRWWIPADGIKEDVIYADIQRYLGPDARVIAGEGRDNDQGRAGYWIAAYRPLTPSMVQDLREASLKLERSGNTGPCDTSMMHRRRPCEAMRGDEADTLSPSLVTSALECKDLAAEIREVEKMLRQRAANDNVAPDKWPPPLEDDTSSESSYELLPESSLIPSKRNA